jgi:HTH-type transcriptional regulator/antitoxin HigA
MVKYFTPAEIFHPGELLKEELDARGWTQVQFAKIIARPLQTVNEIVNGRKRVTAATAKAIGVALGTSPELWVNLQAAYDLHMAAEPDPGIRERAKAIA